MDDLRSSGRSLARRPLQRWARLGVLLWAVARLLSVSVNEAWAADGDIVLFHDDFEHLLSAQWVERGFPSIERKNIFRVAADVDGNHFLQVESTRSSSGMGVYLRFDPQRCPDVRWRWKVSNTLPTADLTRREADDAPAKLYVLFDGPSLWNPLDKRILVYVWDDALPVGTVLPNAWLPDKERMLVVESGRGRVGQWAAERADLAKDFSRAFPAETPGAVEALAFMADTDNTATRVAAGLDDLEIRCRDFAAPERRP